MFDRIGWKITLAAFCGGVAGASLALQFGENLWLSTLIGLVVGSVVSWIAYGPRQFIRVLPKAWRIAWRTTLSPFWASWRWRRGIVRSLLSGLCLGFIILIICISLGFLFGDDDVKGLAYWEFYLASIMMPVLLIIYEPLWIGAIYIAVCTAFSFFAYTDGEGKKNQMNIIKYWNPICFTCYQVPKGIYLFFRHLPELIGALAYFVRLVFKFLHSDWRLLSALGGATGTIAGALIFHQAIIGAVFGALLARVVGYELISKRILKTVPVPINGA